MKKPKGELPMRGIAIGAIVVGAALIGVPQIASAQVPARWNHLGSAVCPEGHDYYGGYCHARGYGYGRRGHRERFMYRERGHGYGHMRRGWDD